MGKKKVRQFMVESQSVRDKLYKVTLYDDGSWACSCPAWIYRRYECHHIVTAKQYLKNNKDNNSKVKEIPIIKISNDYILRPGKVDKVTKEGNTLLIPLIPIPCSTYYLAKIVYDLLSYGVSMKRIKSYFHPMIDSWTKKAVISFIEKNS